MAAIERITDLRFINQATTPEVFVHETRTIWKYDCVLIVWNDTGRKPCKL